MLNGPMNSFNLWKTYIIQEVRRPKVYSGLINSCSSGSNGSCAPWVSGIPFALEKYEWNASINHMAGSPRLTKRSSLIILNRIY
jgi:hypothetical protein